MYAIYLRKSRIDIEAEAHGEMETLKRQEKLLLDYAKRHNIPITKIYKEIVSGESIDARPEMMQLLEDVEDGMWEGVLVAEVERLARGDTIDQGIVSRSFKRHNTKIITPIKTYDPSNEFDEEYFEFGLFMSRREYKTITRRIQRGRLASVKEGKFIGSTAPYGYEKAKIKDGKGYTLVPDEKEADVVRLIYDLYLSGLGMTRIADDLDKRGITPRYRNIWSKSTISDILKNPVYTGKIRWSYKKYYKDRSTGKEIREKSDNPIMVDGMHTALVSDEVFEKAQAIRSGNTRKPLKKDMSLKNPMTGVLICKKCGCAITRLGTNPKNRIETMRCINRNCRNVSAPMDMIETVLIESLTSWIGTQEVEFEKRYKKAAKANINDKVITDLEKEIKTINSQIAKTYDLLEQGIYTAELFSERNTSLAQRLDDTTKKLADLKTNKMNTVSISDVRNIIIPKIKTLIYNYHYIPDAESRNNVLKLLLNYATFNKDKANKKGQGGKVNFEIEIFPKLFTEIDI